MRNKNQEFILIPVTLGYERINWDLIELFRKRFDMLWENLHDLKLGVFSADIHKKNDGTYEGGSTLPSIHRLKGFYTDYRHFYLEKEKTNIFKIMKYLSTLTDSKIYKNFIKEEKSKYKSSFIENNLIKIDGQKLDTHEILDLWFNAEIFHNDEKKLLRLDKVRKSMTMDLWKFIVFMAVYDTSLRIRNIHWSQSKLAKDELFLLMPNRQLTKIDSSTLSK